MAMLTRTATPILAHPPPRLTGMAIPTLEQVNAALATVNDPEIKRPITDLGMVDTVEINDDGSVKVIVLLTVAGCPLKETITRDVTQAVSGVPGVTGVDFSLGVMTAEQRSVCRRRSRAAKPTARSRSLSPVR